MPSTTLSEKWFPLCFTNEDFEAQRAEAVQGCTVESRYFSLRAPTTHPHGKGNYILKISMTQVQCKMIEKEEVQFI